MYEDREKPRPIFDPLNIGAAVLAHLLLFGIFYLFGVMNPEPEDTDEEVTPIECLVVVHENLDGNEDEPPPESEVVDTPPPEPETPPPPVEETPPPPPVEDNPFVEEKEPPKPEPPKPEPPKPVPPKPKPEPPKPEPPKKTPEQLRAEKIAEMRKRMEKAPQTTVKTPPRNNGRTEQRPPDWDKILAGGATPSNRNQGLDASEEQRCAGLIKKAFHDKWNPRPAWTPELKKMTLRVSFDRTGKVTGYTLVNRSGDVAADNSVLNAAKRVIRVSGLSDAYLQKNPTSVINFEVTLK